MSNEKQKTASRSAAPQAKGYSDAGASFQRRAMRGFNAKSGSPNEDINWNNATLRQRSRMLYMSAPLATSAIKTNRTKVVGSGLSLKCDIDFEALGLSPEQGKMWTRQTEAEFRLWSERKMNCDATGMNDFSGLQQLVVTSWLQSGDVFALVKRYDPNPLNPYSLRLHLVEADRISTPGNVSFITHVGMTDGKNPKNGNRIYDGVEVDNNGLVVAYHISNVYPFEYKNESVEWQRVEAVGKGTGLPNILHIMSAERPEQYRGVPYLAAVIEPILQLRRYTESQLMAALIQSFFTAWIKTKTDPNAIPINEVGGGNIAGDIPAMNPQENNISNSENEYEMGPGTVTHLEQDEDIVFGNPQIPTAGFDAFVRTFCELVGSALEIPYEVLLKKFDASYSASRGALLEAWEGFKIRRTWLVNGFCQPVYEIWLSEAVARGRIKAPGFFDDPRIRSEWCRARWIGPVQGQLDPLKEAKAAIMKIDRGISTHAEVTREMGGGDWESNMDKLANENQRRAETDIRNFASWATEESEEEEETDDAEVKEPE